MTRLLRLYMDGCPQHIIQRGDKRQACFAGNDYTFYLLDKLQYQRL
jgi:putative transposase